MLAIQNRFNLADLGDEWAECDILYSKATYADLQSLADLDDSNKAAQVEFMLNFVKSHVTGGRVLELQDDAAIAIPVKPEHIDELPRETIDKLFAAISGVTVDPKGGEPTATPSSTSEDKSPTPTSES